MHSVGMYVQEVRLTREIAVLRTKANREKQLNRCVDLKLESQRLEARCLGMGETLRQQPGPSSL
ncbi:MAG: hypothetical protein PHO89_04520 [Methylacidiphilaceae bacterium]|nr:hypothetical protein [Candidatus Methylacidiphilaceae bacterium]